MEISQAELEKINHDIKKLRAQTMAMVDKSTAEGASRKLSIISFEFWGPVVASLIILTIGGTVGLLCSKIFG